VSKLSYKSLLIIFFLLLISIVVLVKFILPKNKVSAAWWNDGWNYRKAISIGNSSVAQTNTQIKILNNYDLSALVSAGKLQSDLDDLRFTDINGNLLKYWIEDNTNNSADVWGIIPSLPISGTTIYMYYGNSSATSVSSTSNMTIGGTMTSINGYRIHTFLGNGTLTNANNTTAEVLVVAGGGGGGSSQTSSGGGGGGGAGGLTYNSSYALNQGQIINVTVGVGGTNGGTGSNQSGANGSNSVFDTITTIGGGGGARTGTNGNNGGSGGGGGYNGYATVRYGGSGVIGIGNSGGSTTDLTSAAGAGGGGAGGVGGNNKPSHIGGDGGLGSSYSTTGIGVTYATGGCGGGGCSATSPANTGKGGDGAYAAAVARSGANGIVVVRFLSGSAGSPLSEETGGGPIAYWKFDEGSGTTAYDSTSNSHVGTLQNGTSWVSEDQCVSGKCLKFDGVDDYISAGTGANYFPLQTFSTCAWIKTPGLGTGMSINGILSLTYGLSMYLNGSGQFVTYMDDGVNIVGKTVTSVNLHDNKFHHLCLTYDGTNRNMYIDSVQKLSVGSTWLGTTRWPTNGVNIGHENNNSPYYKFNGIIDDVKIYPYARTASQIKLDYNSRGLFKGSSVNLGSNKNNNTLSDGLVGYWKMDENSGTNITDSSGLGHTGIFSGSTLPTWSNGKYGVGVTFNGTSSYINFGNPGLSSLTNATISFWRKAATVNARWLVFRGQDNNYYVMATNGTDAFYHANIGSNTKTIYIDGNVGTTQPSDTNWHHYVMTGVNLSTWTALTLSNYSNYHYNGSIDELRIYNRPLNPSEVSQLYEYAPGPVGYWDLNEASGTIANDKSGNNNNGTLNSSSSWTQGKYGSAGNFNGTNDRTGILYSPILAPTGSITFSAWAYKNNWTSAEASRIISKTETGGYTLLFSNSTIYTYIYRNGVYVTPSTSTSGLSSGWHYFTGSYDGRYTKIYVDGILKNTDDAGANYPLTYSVNNALFIGAEADGDNNLIPETGVFFTGKIDEVKIYNYARTQKQIIEDMNANHPAGSANSMVGYWKFDEGNGTTVYDSSTNKLNGTLQSGTSIPTWSNNGKVNKALNFLNNDNSHISIADSGTNSPIDLTSQFTLSAWVYINSISSYSTIFYKYGTFLLAIRPSGGIWSMISDGTWKTVYDSPSNLVSTGKWQQITLTFDSQNSKLIKGYLNGKLVSSIGISSQVVPNNNPLYIGKGYSGENGNMNGLIDEVKVYNYALTDDEIKQDYNQGSAISFGSSNQTIGGTTTSLDYCIPGDTSFCASPVAEWKMDDGTGVSAKDTSGNNLNGTITGATWTQGKIGKALNFNGNSNYVEISSTPSDVSSFTISTWVKAINGSTSDGYGYIVHRSNTYSIGGSVYFLGINPLGNYVGAVNGNYANGDTGIQSNENIWRFLSLTYDGNTQKVYVDGQLKSSYSLGSITNTITDNRIGFGGTPLYPNYRNIKGQMDHVKIYNYARTPAQIAYDYNKGGPVGWWKFDECQGNTAYDWSGLGNNGTINIGSSGTQTFVGTCTTSNTAWSNGATGHTNSSLNFDGTDDYIKINQPNFQTIPNSFTVTGFINPENQSGYLITPSSNGIDQHLGFDSGNQRLIVSIAESSDTNERSRYSTSGSVPSNKWTHFSVSINDKNIKIYINGVLNSEYNETINIGGWSSFWYIGQRSNSTNWYKGKMDDLRVYNYPLTSEQVKTLYNGGAVSFN